MIPLLLTLLSNPVIADEALISQYEDFTKLRAEMILHHAEWDKSFALGDRMKASWHVKKMRLILKKAKILRDQMAKSGAREFISMDGLPCLLSDLYQDVVAMRHEYEHAMNFSALYEENPSFGEYIRLHMLENLTRSEKM